MTATKFETPAEVVTAFLAWLRASYHFDIRESRATGHTQAQVSHPSHALLVHEFCLAIGSKLEPESIDHKQVAEQVRERMKAAELGRIVEIERRARIEGERGAYREALTEVIEALRRG